MTTSRANFPTTTGANSVASPANLPATATGRTNLQAANFPVSNSRQFPYNRNSNDPYRNYGAKVASDTHVRKYLLRPMSTTMHRGPPLRDLSQITSKKSSGRLRNYLPNREQPEVWPKSIYISSLRNIKFHNTNSNFIFNVWYNRSSFYSKFLSKWKDTSLHSSMLRTVILEFSSRKNCFWKFSIRELNFVRRGFETAVDPP